MIFSGLHETSEPKSYSVQYSLCPTEGDKTQTLCFLFLNGTLAKMAAEEINTQRKEDVNLTFHEMHVQREKINK